jgi:hypothetical protein
VEIRFNTLEGGGKAPFAKFQLKGVCHLLGQGGDQSKIESQGVKAWDFQSGGYRVTLGYRVSTPEASANVDVTLQSIEGHNRGDARQWVVLPESEVSGQFEPTPRGTRVLDLWQQSGAVATQWCKDLSSGQSDTAYLNTLEPGRRGRVSEEYQTRQALAELCALPCLGLGGPNLSPAQQAKLYLTGYRQFRQGDWVNDDLDTFWAPSPAVRDEFAQTVKKMLREDGTILFRSQELALGLWRQETGRLEFSYECPLFVPDVGPLPKYVGEARVVLETDAKALESSGAADWQVVRIDLLRAGTPPMPRMPGGRAPQ